ncbi:hypothetical protein [Sphingobium sp. D43FB]|uniref:hypothetical protein n=1 Tax=Sphingobium sp. D43FB TaxID=2017595 RepID=UPI000BB53307|nr:hypothetical protein [Sphingobium sp. D43FB]PBN41504.1 hypothetical protein SxD43FB_21405 [Sphingobium sp. D43FB]
MAVSAITRVPFALPNMPARPTYELTDRDRRLLSYDALKVWIKPDADNMRRSGKALRIAGRKGYMAYTGDDAILIGDGMTGDAKPVIKMPGNTTGSGELPLHVQGYELNESTGYFVACVIKFGAAMVASGVPYTFFAGGVDTSDHDVQFYMLNNAMALSHGNIAAQQTTGPLFTAGGCYLVWASYDPASKVGAVGVNSVSPRNWATANVLEPAGAGRQVAIGGKFNVPGTAGTQMFLGDMAEVFICDEQWVTPDKEMIRADFLADVASLYGADFTLA